MAEAEVNEDGHHEQEADSHDPHFEPIISLPAVEIKSTEEDEETLFKMRAKLFRLDKTEKMPEWKERGVGDMKILQHKTTRQIRIIMRREKVLKLCANHLILPEMELIPNCGSDRAWMWNTPSDYSESEPQPELLAIRFANEDNAHKFKEQFDLAREVMRTLQVNRSNESADEAGKADQGNEGDGATDAIVNKLDHMTLGDQSKKSSMGEVANEKLVNGATEDDVIKTTDVEKTSDATTPDESS